MKDECAICQRLGVWKCCPKMETFETPKERSTIVVKCKFFNSNKKE